MMKRVTPKRVTLPDGRTFVGRFKRVPRSRLPPRKNKKKVQRCTFEAKGQGDSVCHKKIVTVWKKSSQKIITSSATKNLAKNPANKALDKAPDVIDSLSNRTNNKTIKKVLNANISKAVVNKVTRNLRRIIRNWDTL